MYYKYFVCFEGSKSGSGGDDEGASYTKEEIEQQKVEYQTQVKKVIYHCRRSGQGFSTNLGNFWIILNEP